MVAMKRIKLTNPFKCLSVRDYIIWALSVVINFAAFAITGFKDVLTLLSAIIGITSLIFNAKGHVIGEFIGVAFAIVYSIISYYLRYYSELITYAFMTGPICILSIITWLRNPFGNSGQVTVANLTKKKIALMSALTVIVTVVMFFVLRALNTPNLAVSTISITTSFLACYLLLLRSPWYAIAYSANDIVLIILWLLATIANIAYLPMVTCFAVFLFNDIYSFICWCKMRKSQSIALTNEKSESDNLINNDESTSH